MFTGFRLGKLGLATSITSTEGVIAAFLSVIYGEVLPSTAYLWLAVTVVGIVVVSLAPERFPLEGERRGLATAFALCAAVTFGASLYATGRISPDLAVAWVLLPPRLVGVVFVALPLAVTGRLRLSRSALPLVVMSGAAEVLGNWSFAIGARGSISVAAVLASLFAPLATVGAWLLFGERLSRHQILGIAAVSLGVVALTATLA